MYASPYDTIAAVSTPYGKGGIAVIRLSGEEAVTVAARVFTPMSGRPLTDYADRTAVYGTISDPTASGDGITPEASPAVLDDGMCVIFRAPHSFTGENTAEISCHGGVLVTRNVLEACFRAGARQALPGEYTRRAFLNGKMDLEKAEALGNLLDAGNDEQVRLARAGMNGLLTGRADAVYTDLCGVLSNMEAGMDFPEEDLTEMPPDEIRAVIRACLGRVEELIRTYRTGHAIAEGLPTVICGRPNVGKSAFYNRLVGRDAAIVTAIAGTTRDILTDTVSCGRVTLRLSDTAGLRESDDPIEQIGVNRARQALEEAELVFLLIDPYHPSPEDEELTQSLREAHKHIIRVYTKQDLDEQTAQASSVLPADCPDGDDLPTVWVSSHTGEGFDRLAEAVERLFIDHDLRMGEEAVVFSARQAATLRDSAEALRTACENLTAGLPYDICADDIRAAMLALGELCGREVREDVISEIFSRFCVGK